MNPSLKPLFGAGASQADRLREMDNRVDAHHERIARYLSDLGEGKLTPKTPIQRWTP